MTANARLNKQYDRKIFYVHGGTDTETRENIREITENEKDAIIIASYGTFSTGINIRNLHNVVFSSPSKSRIRVLQSIGRGLRQGTDKSTATLYDIALFLYLCLHAHRIFFCHIVYSVWRLQSSSSADYYRVFRQTGIVLMYYLLVLLSSL